MNLLKNKLFIGIFLITCSIGLTAMKSVNIYDPSGSWSYEIEAGENTLTGQMTIKKVKDSFEVEIESDVYGNLQLESVEFKKNTLTGDVDVQGVSTEFEMEFEKDSMTGKVYYEDQELSLSAVRK